MAQKKKQFGWEKFLKFLVIANTVEVIVCALLWYSLSFGGGFLAIALLSGFGLIIMGLFPILLIVNIFGLFRYVNEVKPHGSRKVKSILGIIASSIVLIWLLTTAYQSAAERDKATSPDNIFTTNISRESALTLINECKVSGFLVGEKRVKLFLKDNSAVYASWRDYDALKKAFSKASKECK